MPGIEGISLLERPWNHSTFAGKRTNRRTKHVWTFKTFEETVKHFQTCRTSKASAPGRSLILWNSDPRSPRWKSLIPGYIWLLLLLWFGFRGTKTNTSQPSESENAKSFYLPALTSHRIDHSHSSGVMIFTYFQGSQSLFNFEVFHRPLHLLPLQRCRQRSPW